MAAFYECAVRTPAAAAGATYATIHTGSTLRGFIREIGIINTTATANSIGIIRPSNTPVASTSTLGQGYSTGDPASTINVDTAWSTAPTIGTAFLRRVDLAASVGTGVIFTWPNGRGLELAVSSWLVVWNFGSGTGSVLDVYVAWEE